MKNDMKIALLVDVDNVKISKDAMDELLQSLNQIGEVVYCKFYGYNDRKHLYLTDFINNYGYETAPFMRLKKRFSQLDNRIMVDAVKINYTKPEINGFCIVAGDGDLIPLLVELKSCGKTCLDINSDYQELNAHMFDEHIVLKSIDSSAEAYLPKTKKVSKPVVNKPAAKKPVAAPVKQVEKVEPVVEEPIEEEKISYVEPEPVIKPTYKTPAKSFDDADDLDSYIEDELYDESDNEADLSEVLKDITSRYNKLDFTNDENMSEKLRLIRDIENLIERENAKGEGIYSSNEDMRQIFTDLQDVVDDMKNAL